jgi:IMP dehydrogenase
MKIQKTLAFDDVLLKPKYSNIESRGSIDLSVNLRDLKIDLPIISSPMDTVTESDMLVAMDTAGGFGVAHRYNTINQQSKIVHIAHTKGAQNIAAAVGVSGDYIDRAKSLVIAGANILCVDIAHGHHSLMKNALKCLRSLFDPSVYIIAGNVATLEGFNDLADWGADAVRIGIGGGSICSTRIQTGHGVPTFQSIIDCAASDRDAALIADGGIRTSGDVCKAIAAGADFVMLGSGLAGTDETPGEILHTPEIVNGKQVYSKIKVYRGMASVEAQIQWRGHASSEEGVSSTVPYKGPVGQVIKKFEKGLRSGLSYSGSKNIVEFHAKAEFICQTQSGQIESSTHVNLIR